MKILDKGSLTLERVEASDLSVVNAARVSLNAHHTQLEEGDVKLIRFLMRNHHGTPFEHNFFCFQVKAPLFVFREWHRHRIGHSYNEWSGRYSVLEAEFYIPENIRTQVGKPGHYTYEDASPEVAEWLRGELTEACEFLYESYQEALRIGIAKEQARFFLPVNLYSKMYWTCNARSLMNFLNLRNADSAMWEIRQYAIAVEGFFAEHMPITHQAFIDNGRMAP